ncbi:MAG TPA: gliding motility-associated C-terminal domain-containing protein, partial [Chitinophagaceae bacterium]|nr:gliding motility-associated C-terminal domain-containing protein [Chitinophagaceae bacterium]
PVTLPLHSPASFYLSVIDSVTGCTSNARVEVDVIKVDTALSVSGDSVFCANKPVTTSLQALSMDGIIQWYENNAAIGGANGNLFNPQPLMTSTYWASVKNGSCINNTRSVIIQRLPVPAADFSFGSNEQCINAPFHILNKSTEPSINNYTWQLSDGRSFSSKDLLLAFSQPGRIGISLKVISAEGCRDSISKSIEIVERCDVYVPTAFTPGDNGRNDGFMPRFTGLLKFKRFTVYDRGGYIVFSTNKPGEGWDGRVKGRAVPTSVLVWILEYEAPEGRPMMQKGTVTLIR